MRGRVFYEDKNHTTFFQKVQHYCRVRKSTGSQSVVVCAAKYPVGFVGSCESCKVCTQLLAVSGSLYSWPTAVLRVYTCVWVLGTVSPCFYLQETETQDCLILKSLVLFWWQSSWALYVHHCKQGCISAPKLTLPLQIFGWYRMGLPYWIPAA